MITIILFMVAVAPNVHTRLLDNCPPEDGWCLRPDGHDLNSGAITLVAPSRDLCLAACRIYYGAKGCEWSGYTCTVHTQEIGGGSGDHAYSCWIFSKCQAVTLQSQQTDGMWGQWGVVRRCPTNQYVYGYRLRSEKNQGGGDDTALNAIELQCAAKGSGGGYTTIASSSSEWGTFSQFTYCQGSDNPVTGFTMRQESYQGKKNDDTAANDVELFCKNGGYISAPAKTHWGDWTPILRCPKGYAVMGISTRVESYQRNADDTGLNGVRLLCRYY